MRARGPVEFANTKQNVALLNRRILISGAVMLVLAAVILLRLMVLQIASSDHYTTLSRSNRLKVLAIEPPRGLIFTRDGAIVAENRPSFALVLDTAKVADVRKTVALVQALLQLRDEQLEPFYEELRVPGRFSELTLVPRLSEKQVAVFSANGYRFPGIRVDARLSRYYPDSDYWVHLVGYVGRINEQELQEIDATNYRATTHMGKTGVEKSYEAILHGEVGYRQVEVNAQGRILRVVDETPPRPGHDIYLTVDGSLQRAAAAALGNHRGAIVAIDPLTGGILAFVSKPSFDANPFVDGIGSRTYAALRDSLDRPLFNRALQGQYPPGSTIKPVLALAGLETGKRTARDHTPCPGWYRLPNDRHRYRDWVKQGHGQVDLTRAIAESCDVYFYALARDLGIVGMHEFATRFGFGAATGIDLPGEAGGLFPSPEWKRQARKLPWYPGETLSVGIGQGFTLVTPLQLAYATAVLARHGYGVTPHVVGQIEDPLLHDAVEPQLSERQLVSLRSEEYWDVVTHGMEEVVHGTRGTARRTSVGARYRYAGKSGTAQLYALPEDDTAESAEVDERLRDHAWFIAFGPLDQPQIAVAVLVENGGGGSSVAAPIARIVLDHYLQSDYADTTDRSE